MLKLRYEENKLKECTFKPRILSYRKLNNSIEPKKSKINSSFEASPDRCRLLYEIAKKKNSINEFNHTTSEILDDECVFRPTINKDQVFDSLPNTSKAAIDNAINRIRSGRVERERIQSALARSTGGIDMKFTTYESPSRIQNNRKVLRNSPKKKQILTKSEALSPISMQTTPSAKKNKLDKFKYTHSIDSCNIKTKVLLFIDVKIKGVKKRITIHNGENTNELLERFAQENSN